VNVALGRPKKKVRLNISERKKVVIENITNARRNPNPPPTRLQQLMKAKLKKKEEGKVTTKSVLSSILKKQKEAKESLGAKKSLEPRQKKPKKSKTTTCSRKCKFCKMCVCKKMGTKCGDKCGCSISECQNR